MLGEEKKEEELTFRGERETVMEESHQHRGGLRKKESQKRAELKGPRVTRRRNQFTRFIRRFLRSSPAANQSPRKKSPPAN